MKHSESPTTSSFEGARLAFIYGARETIWPGIVQSLLAEGGAIESTLTRCDDIVRAKLGWSLGEMSNPDQYPPEHALEPTLTAVQAALTDGWRARGVRPDVVGARCGGEFAAAYARGKITLDDAMEVACRLSRQIMNGGATGNMLAVQMDIAEVERVQQSSPVAFAIAADDPHLVTIVSCHTQDLAQLRDFLAAQGAGHQLLAPGVAYHNSEIDGWRDGFIAPLSGHRPSLPRIPGYSATAGGLLDEHASDVEHFWRVVREPAIVAPVLQQMVSDGCDIFLEVGGHPCMEDMIQDGARGSGRDIMAVCSMRRRAPFREVGNETLATLARAGYAIAGRAGR
jgi:acyl transferase domain-containing protein